MANFQQALSKTLKWEGNYSCDKDDRGGETWQGVTRKHHPLWKGWEIIDSLRAMSNFPLCLLSNYSLKVEVEDLYRQKYWNIIKGDDIEHQCLAEKLFDVAVNMGIKRATMFLQQAVNTLMETTKIFEDGIMGAKTLAAVKEFGLLQGYDKLIAAIRILQENKYNAIVANDPTQKKFLKGWMNRVAA